MSKPQTPKKKKYLPHFTLIQHTKPNSPNSKLSTKKHEFINKYQVNKLKCLQLLVISHNLCINIVKIRSLNQIIKQLNNCKHLTLCLFASESETAQTRARPATPPLISGPTQEQPWLQQPHRESYAYSGTKARQAQ